MILFLFLTGVLLLCVPVRAVTLSHAEEAARPELYEVTVANSSNYLLAYFSLRNGATPEVHEALQTGIAVRYVYELELRVPRPFFHKTLASLQVIRTVTFDGLKGEYRVALETPGPRVIGVRTFDEAAPLAFQINDLPVFPLSRLLTGQVHYLRVRARAEKVGSSLPFEDLLRIFSPWGFETNWYEVRFRY